MTDKKHFYLHSKDGKFYEKLTAKELIETGMPRSTAYRAIKRGTLPRHKLRELQLRYFGDLKGWDGWKIGTGVITSPEGTELTQTDIENLIYIKKILWDWDL